MFKRILGLLWFTFAFLNSAHAVRPTIVFMTDFGTVDDSVAICKGVIYKIEPEALIIDLTHQVTPYVIQDAARFLAGTTSYYPAGTIFLSVVDPGVGSSRKPIIVKSKKGHFFVLPDNGLITLVQDQEGIEEARVITNSQWTLGDSFSSTFHGRDIFAPAAAYLASGKNWTEVGPVITNLVRLPIQVARVIGNKIEGEIIGLDGPFGNLITNVSAEMFHQLGIKNRELVTVSVGTQEFDLPFVKTFSDVPAGKTLLYVDSRGRIGLAINRGDFAKRYRVTPPVKLLIRSTANKQVSAK
jgi:S-adenosylmethionine hydrolase